KTWPPHMADSSPYSERRILLLRQVERGAVQDGVYILNGKFYQVSTGQYKENLDYLTRGFSSYLVPVTVEPATVGPEDAHLNEHANDQVMKDLATAIESAIPARR